jgi:hypothetical protein
MLRTGEVTKIATNTMAPIALAILAELGPIPEIRARIKKRIQSIVPLFMVLMILSA